jgi:hypothetical protein
MNPDVFHISHINNLASIIQSGGLISDAIRIKQKIGNQNIGYSHIKQRRLQHLVTVSQRGVIGNYVPFNFCPRSVMLFVVYRGHTDYNGGQQSILHLMTDVERVRAHNPDCFFTDIHADLGYAEQIADFSRIKDLNWDYINRSNWRDPVIKETKQAEFLAFNSVPWAAIKEIGVINQQVAAQVSAIILNHPHQPLVSIKPQWYY